MFYDVNRYPKENPLAAVIYVYMYIALGHEHHHDAGAFVLENAELVASPFNTMIIMIINMLAC